MLITHTHTRWWERCFSYNNSSHVFVYNSHNSQCITKYETIRLTSVCRCLMVLVLLLYFFLLGVNFGASLNHESVCGLSFFMQITSNSLHRLLLLFMYVSLLIVHVHIHILLCVYMSLLCVYFIKMFVFWSNLSIGLGSLFLSSNPTNPTTTETTTTIYDNNMGRKNNSGFDDFIEHKKKDKIKTPHNSLHR